jgi:hypothetical protein
LLALKLPSLRSLTAGWCYLTLPQMQPFLNSPVGMQLRRVSMTVPDPEAWIPLFASRRLEYGFVHQTGNAWYLTFEGDRIDAGYYDGGHSRSDAVAGAELQRVLDLVPAPQTWHVTISRVFEIPEVLETTLKRFASYVVQPVSG